MVMEIMVEGNDGSSGDYSELETREQYLVQSKGNCREGNCNKRSAKTKLEKECSRKRKQQVQRS